MRKANFVNGEYHHVFNRGVDKRQVFMDREDYERFLQSMVQFNRTDPIGSLYEQRLREKRGVGSSAPSVGVQLPRIVDVVCYCLNPNHYHLLLRQIQDRGIEKFMQKINTGYTNYFNKKNNRSGALFQGRYKSSFVDSNDHLLYVSAYVNCNSEAHKISRAEEYEWCSFPEYAGKQKGCLCQKEVILGQFKNPKEYFDYAKANAKEMAYKKEAESGS